jgi:hypothetical protein
MRAFLALTSLALLAGLGCPKEGIVPKSQKDPATQGETHKPKAAERGATPKKEKSASKVPELGIGKTYTRKVTSEPSGASVYLVIGTKTLIGTTPFEWTYQGDTILQAGNPMLDFQKEGYKSASRFGSVGNDPIHVKLSRSGVGPANR